MKRLGVIFAILVILAIGGGLTSRLVSTEDNPSAPVLPVLRQTGNPEAAVSDMVGWKAEQMFLAIGFILFNLIGIGGTIALVFWFIDRGIRRSQAEAAAAASENAVVAASRDTAADRA